MRITAADLNAYRAALSELAADAAGYVSGRLAHTSGMQTWKTKDVAIAAITDSIGSHGMQAQAYAGAFFDEVCAAEGIDAASELYEDAIDLDMLETEIYFFARKLVEGDRTGFTRDCSNLADYYVMRSAYENTVRNCAANNMRYARIPTGPDTCDWCLMLASRGFVYYTEHDALAGNHRFCDCIVCPGRGGDTFNDATQVEGYDPDEYYQLWRKSGFMPPKNNPQKEDGSYERKVYNHDGSTQRRDSRRMRKMQSELRNLNAHEREAIFERLNAASSREALDEAFKDVIGDFIKRGDTLKDQDWEDVGNHYHYLLEEIERKKKRKG